MALAKRIQERIFKPKISAPPTRQDAALDKDVKRHPETTEVPKSRENRPRPVAETQTTENAAATRPPRVELPDLHDFDRDTRVGQMLLRLNEACALDIEEPRVSGSTRSAQKGAASANVREALDPRRNELDSDSRPGRFDRASRAIPRDREVFALLSAMLEKRASPDPRPRLARARFDPNEGDHSASERKWSEGTRLRVRLYNVLSRWSRAVSDPQLREVTPLAPVGNYVALLTAIAESWEEDYLPEDRIIRLLTQLFSAFIGRDGGSGYLLSLGEKQRRDALELLAPPARELAGALAYAGLRPLAGWQQHIFEWRPFLRAGLPLGVFAAGEESRNMVARLVGMATSSANEIEKRLAWSADYTNDQEWCQSVESDLQLQEVEFIHDFAPEYDAQLDVTGISDPLRDPSVVTLIRRVIAYRKGANGIVLRMGPNRLSVKGGCVAAIVSEKRHDSEQVVTDGLLESLESRGEALVGVMRAANPELATGQKRAD